MILLCLRYTCSRYWTLPVWPPFVYSNKAALGSNDTASSLQKTSPNSDPAALSRLPSLTMDSIDQLLHLRQGGLSIEEYVHQFCELSYQVPLYVKFLFKNLFHFGLNEPIKSLHKSFFPGGEFKGSLSVFMDYALKLSDSPFTVGATEEERDAVLPRERTPAPEHAHKMAVTTESGRKMAVTTTPRHVIATNHESSQVTADLPEPHNRPSKPGPARVMSATPESPAKMATTPADAPLWPGLIASVLDPPLVSVRAAGIPRSAALSAPSQEPAEAAPSQELAESAPEAAPSQELAESAPEAAPSQELAESAPEAAPSQELAESAPEAAPSQELAESGSPGPQLVQSGSPEPLLVPPGSPEPLLVPPGCPEPLLVPHSSASSTLAPPSSPTSLVPSSLALSERPWDSAPAEHPLEFVVFPKEIVLGGPPAYRPTESPDPSWLPEAPDLQWSPRTLPTLVLETICALVFQFSLGPSLCRGSRLRPGGRLSRLLRPGGRLSRLLRPGGRLSRLLRPGGRLSRQSRLTSPLTCQSRLTSPLTCQSRLTSPLTCQSHFSSPLTLQNLKWRTQQLSCQSLVTPQQFTQCHFTSLLSLLPRPGGLLSHLPQMDLALRSLPRFHLRSTWIVPCVKRLKAALWEGGSVTNLVAISPHGLLHHTTAAHHSTSDYNSHHSLHLRHTHSHPPLHQSHSCHQSLMSPDCLTTPAPHSHTHISSTLPCTHREVLFSPVWHFRAFTPSIFSLFVTWTVLTTPVCSLPFWPRLPFDILSVCLQPRPLHCLCWWFCFAFVTPVLVTELCLSDLLLFIVIKLHLDLTTLLPHYNQEWKFCR